MHHTVITDVLFATLVVVRIQIRTTVGLDGRVWGKTTSELWYAKKLLKWAYLI